MDEAHENIISAILRSCLTSETTKYRNRIIIMCIVAFIFLQMNIVPTEFAPFGIKFEPKDANQIKIAIFLVHLYFVFMFIFNVIADMLSWSATVWQAYIWNADQIIQAKQPPNRLDVWPKPVKLFGILIPNGLGWLSISAGIFRNLVDIALPVALGLVVGFQLFKSLP